MNRTFNPPPAAGSETDKEKLKKQISDLKESVKLERKIMSTCIQDMWKFMQEHKEEDYLLHSTGTNTNRGPNPFIEKKRCTLL